MIAPESFYFDSQAGFRLHGRYWNKEGATATVIGVHGYSEHSGRYLHFADFLVQNNYEVIWFDLPGHGLSEGKRGNIDRFHHYVVCLEALVKEAERRNCPRPFYLFGHSLGGLIATRFMQTSSMSIQMRALMLSSPLFGLAGYSPLGLSALRLFTNLVPNFSVQQSGKLADESLSHDKELMAERAADPLIKPRATSHWVRESLGARRKAFSEAEKISIPTAIFQAGDDVVTNRHEAERFFSMLQAPKKQWKLYENFYHEILNEIGRDAVMNDMLAWLQMLKD